MHIQPEPVQNKILGKLASKRILMLKSHNLYFTNLLISKKRDNFRTGVYLFMHADSSPILL